MLEELHKINYNFISNNLYICLGERLRYRQKQGDKSVETKMNQDEEIKRLYMEMYDSLISYAYAVLQNNALSEEAVQETFRIACVKPNALFDSKNPKGWIVNTLKNVINNTKRSRAKMNSLLVSLLQSNKWSIKGCYDEVDVDVLYSNLLGDADYQLLKKVALEQKTLLEISCELGISVEACTKRVQRARKALRKKLSENEK